MLPNINNSTGSADRQPNGQKQAAGNKNNIRKINYDRQMQASSTRGELKMFKKIVYRIEYDKHQCSSFATIGLFPPSKTIGTEITEFTEKDAVEAIIALEKLFGEISVISFGPASPAEVAGFCKLKDK